MDVRRLHHARVRLRPHQERLHDLPEEYRHLLDRLPRLLRRRLQSHVRRYHRRLHRRPRLPVRILGRRGLPRERGWRCGQRRRQRLLRHVRLVLPDGLRRDRGLHSVRRHGGAGEDVVLLSLHASADRAHLPHRRRLDVGRRMAGRVGLPGLCRFDHRAQHRRVGRARGSAGRRPQAGQVPARRERQAHAAFQYPGGDARRIHPLVRLVRLQRRVAAGPGNRRRCRGDEPRAGQHHSGRRRRRRGGARRLPGPCWDAWTSSPA